MTKQQRHYHFAALGRTESTPIACRRVDDYELDLVQRKNITTAERPLGVYHPHEELHHIKKENSDDRSGGIALPLEGRISCIEGRHSDRL